MMMCTIFIVFTQIMILIKELLALSWLILKSVFMMN